MKKVLLLTTIGVFCLLTLAKAQNVFNPNDKNRRWVNNGTNYSNDSTASTANPNPNIAGLQKWVSVKTSGVDSNSWGKDYKAYYINYNGIQLAFRVKYPKSYQNPDSAGKKYPTMLFFHGAGEPGCPTNGGLYNNEKQLVHGGQTFRNAVESNRFDGFLLYPQAQAGTGCWSDWGVAGYAVIYNAVVAMLDSMGKYARLDVDRVIVDGLSNGGVAAWSFTAVYPQRVAKSAPAAAATPHNNYSDYVHIPIWFASGGLDTNPSPSYAASSYNGVKNAGGDIRWTLYPDLGHSVWNTLWAEPDFIPFMNDMHKANPLVYFQRYDYCPDSVINARIGITGGFYAYEWQKDGVTIATRTNGVNTIVDGSSIVSYTGNEVTVKSFGTYRVRFKRTASSDWTIYSPKPAVIYSKPITATPAITVDGNHSKVLPAPDETNTVPLALPEGFASYQWVRVSDNAVVSTSNKYVAPVGQYKAKALELYGCGSQFSPIFTVVSASGSPKPDGAKNLSAFASSITSIQLDWNENPNAGQNETGFEIYRATQSGGPYQLVAITPADVITYIDQNLPENKQFFYIVRAVGEFGAAANSNEATAKTQQDLIPPTAPAGLTVTCASRTNVTLKWNSASDNLAVYRYDIYINGVKSYATENTSFSINELEPTQTFSFVVKARDAAGNVSQPSNQVTANTVLQGICYLYFQNQSGLVEVPDYNALQPVAEGIAPNVAFTAGGTDYFGYLWQGYIRITQSGNYRFQTCSDDGSKLYLNQPYNHTATPIVSNDGLHGTTCVTSASIPLAVGYYPIAATFFEEGGGQAMTLNWSRNNSSFTAVPNSAFTESFSPSGDAPEDPSNVSATAVSYSQINLTWTDNSTNETGFEISRATSLTGTYIPVATIAGTSYSDTALTPGTAYYYQIRAIGQYGQSNATAAEVIWSLDNTYADAMGSTTRTLSGSGGPSFNASDKVSGTHSLSFDGSNDYITVNNSTSGGFPSNGGFSKRTISLWVKPGSTSGKRMLVDLGGSDYGLGIRFNSNALQAGVANSNTRNSISLSNFASNGNWNSGGWNNIVLVYSGNSLRLYLNGTQVAFTTGLSFSSISGNSNSGSRFGYSNGNNVFNDASNTYSYYSGLMDDIRIYSDEAASVAEVAELVAGTRGQSMDTTFAAPAIPASPTNLVADVVSKDNIMLTWNDNSADESSFEVWRSVGNQLNYRLVKTIPGGAGATKNYSDTALFANVTYYYQVKATGIGGPSGFTNVASATTLNTPPVISNILDFTMKYGTTYSLPVNAVDADGDALQFTFDYLPYWVTAEEVSNGNVNLIFDPSIGDQGAFTITAYVSDGHDGHDTTSFTLVVNNNTVPTMPAITNKVVDEGKSLVIPVSANDAEGNEYMVWYFENLPSFASFTDNGNGTGAITLQPGYAASGAYSMTVFADDGMGAWTSRTFNVTVNEVDPNESIKVNFRYYGFTSPGWNDVNLVSSPAPFNRGSLVNTSGITTTVGINALTSNYNGSGGGAQTGNDSGVLPDNVMKDYLEWGIYNFGTADTLRLRVYGLDPAKRYNFVFLGSSTVNCCGINSNSSTRYIIGNEVATVRYYLNTAETDTIYQVAPNAQGEVIITMAGDAATLAGGMLNALVIDAAYDDGTAPAKPTNLNGYFVENEGIRLTWEDRAYNEFQYKIYRATSKTGPYTLVNPGASNRDSVGYTDGTAAQYTTYYYYVAGANNYGDGASSDTIKVVTLNNRPLISNLENFKVKTDGSFQEDFNVSDVASDVLSVYIPNMPSFLSVADLGGGNYRVTANPTVDNLGMHYLTVVAKDDKGGESSQPLLITVADKNTRSFYVSFGDYNKVSPAPWNNFLHYGGQGQVINGLVDESNTASAISMVMTDGWSSMFTTGHKTGNNSGVVPDTVLRGGIYYSGTNQRRITISGLSTSPTKRYNIVIVGSQNEGLDARMRVTTDAGSQSDTLNARYNTNSTANLNGLATATGSIVINFTKLSTGTTNMYLNAIIIEEYESSITLMNPVNLSVEPLTQNTVTLTWSDRSNNENAASDGFQLQRATDSLFTNNVTNINIWGNNSAYVNTGLTANTKYWYRIRAKSGVSTYSDWSNRVKTVTPQSVIFVNFNQNVQNAGSPWNNFETFPDAGVSFVNLKNESNVNTGLTLTITRPFNGENNAGMNTGNDSGMDGLVPDQVLQSGYWMDNQQKCQFKLTGLNQGKRYRIGFISSSNWIGGNLTATFSISGNTRYINSWQNTSKIVYIGDLVADGNGELEITISTIDLAANAYATGLIIEMYTDVNGGAVLNGIRRPGQALIAGNTGTNDTPAENLLTTVEKENEISTYAYPNPFSDIINLDFTNTSADNIVGVDIYDLNGRLVAKRSFGKLAAGMNTLRIGTAEAKLSKGVYLLSLTINGKAASVTKMVKTK